MLPVGLCSWQGLEDHSFGCCWSDIWHLCACSVLAGFTKMRIPSHISKLQAERAKGDSFSGFLQRSLHTGGGVGPPVWLSSGPVEGLTLDPCCSRTQSAWVGGLSVAHGTGRKGSDALVLWHSHGFSQRDGA